MDRECDLLLTNLDTTWLVYLLISIVPCSCFKVVVSVEHLDGSANMASYMDHNGKRNWLQNTHAAIPINKIKLQDRAKQLRKVQLSYEY